MFLGVGRGNKEAQPGRAFFDRREGDGHDVDAPLEELLGQEAGNHGVPDNDGHDGIALGRAGVQALALGVFEKIPADVLELMHPLGLTQHDFQRLAAGRGNDRGHAHAEYETRRTVFEKFYQVAAARDETAAPAHGLGQGAHPHVHVRGVYAVIFARAAPGLAQHAQRVGFVHQEHAVVFLFELNDPGQVRDVAVHAEQPLGNDDRVFVLAAVGFKHLLQRVAVVVGV